MVPKLLGVTPHRAAQDLGFYVFCLRAAAVVPHIAGKLSRRAFRKCIIRVLVDGKFGQRTGKVLTSSA